MQNIIKQGNTITYKQLANYLVKNYGGSGFSEKSLKLISDIPDSKNIIKEKLLKLSKLMIKNPVEIFYYNTDKIVSISFLDFQKGNCGIFYLRDNEVYIDLLTEQGKIK